MQKIPTNPKVLEKIMRRAEKCFQVSARCQKQLSDSANRERFPLLNKWNADAQREGSLLLRCEKCGYAETM